jgi:hypothetical protein
LKANVEYMYKSLRTRFYSEKKIYLISLFFVLIADGIGEIKFHLGSGIIILFPVFYAIILGVLSGPQVSKIINTKEVQAASKLVIVGICPFIVKLGITAGANLDMVINAGPALLLHGFGNVLGLILGLPVAMLLGMRHEAIGTCSSLNREYHMAVINDVYGASSAESDGSLALYIVGGMIGAIYFGVMASFVAMLGWFTPQALGMASGVGAGIFMASASASLASIFPAHAAAITTMASTSNTIAGITGIYITMFIAIPLTEKFYKILLPLFQHHHILRTRGGRQNAL